MKYDRGDSFPFYFKPNEFYLVQKPKLLKENCPSTTTFPSIRKEMQIYLVDNFLLDRLAYAFHFELKEICSGCFSLGF